jgi:hypothetical protein
MRRLAANTRYAFLVALLWVMAASAQAGAAPEAQQPIGSRTILTTVTGTGSRPLVDLEVDDFVVEEGGQPREVLSLHVADYPVVVLLDDTEAARASMPTMTSAMSRFVTRIGERAVAVGTLTDPASTLASFDDARRTVLDRIAHVAANRSGPPMVLQAAANGARLIRENGTPFSAIVILSAQPVSASQASDREFLTPILESRAAVYVVASRPPPLPGAPSEQDDVLRALAEQTGGQYTTIYSPVSYAVALDRLADQLATEMMIEYVVPPGGPGGDVRVGVRIPGARATGLGVSR